MSSECVSDLVLHELDKLVLDACAFSLCSHDLPFRCMFAELVICILPCRLPSFKILSQKPVHDPLYFGCLIIKSGDADGQISGALSTTGETLRPALQIIKCAPGITCVSGAMLMITQTPEYGENGVLVIGDVAVTPMPDASQLAQIAVCTAQTAKSVAGFADPKVAMLHSVA